MTKTASVSQNEAAASATTTPVPIPDRLLDAALSCFRRLGSKRTRIEDIAAEAGIARTAVYRYFPNKRAIVAALATRWLAEDEAALAAIARDQSQAPVARLQAFLRADAEYARRYVADSCLFEVLDEVVRSLTPVLLQHRAHIRRHLAGLLAEGSAHGVFPSSHPERLAQILDDLTGSFHDPRLAAGLDDGAWRNRVEAAVAFLVKTAISP